MLHLTARDIRLYRLMAHGLDARKTKADALEAAGACGLQNTPPGAWETALYNRVDGLGVADMNVLLHPGKALLQAWSFRGAPVVFPSGEADVFLSALVPEPGEEWLYTHGIGLALDALRLPFDDLLHMLVQVMPSLDGDTVHSKAELDHLLARRMLPLLPPGSHAVWNRPSMYGQPDRQTVGGAAVSFLLRPCALLGLVVFGERRDGSPTFTSFKTWMGHPLVPRPDAAQRLVRKFVHAYGPTTPRALAAWLGCSPAQAQRLWDSIRDELEPVITNGKKAYILSADREILSGPPSPQRTWLWLGPHDPYLDQRDREILLPDKALQRKVWQTVANPGVILHEGSIAGTWTATKKAGGLSVRAALWQEVPGARHAVRVLAEEYAAFRGLEMVAFTLG